MMTELPPDVRDRAAQAAYEVWRDNGRVFHRADWANLVDAVAEVLADHWAPSAFAFLDPTDVEVERDVLKARVDLLTTTLTALVEHWDDGEYYGEMQGARARAVLSATPTGCRFCGEPESDTVWCCDERMEADGPTEDKA